MSSTNDVSALAKRLSDMEMISGIVWLVIGIMQCLSIVFAIVGVLNIVSAIKTIKRSKSVLTPWRGMVAMYEGQLTSIIICTIYNLIFGGAIGVVGCIFDFIIRDFVLKNKAAFESAC